MSKTCQNCKWFKKHSVSPFGDCQIPAPIWAYPYAETGSVQEERFACQSLCLSYNRCAESCYYFKKSRSNKNR